MPTDQASNSGAPSPSKTPPVPGTFQALTIRELRQQSSCLRSKDSPAEASEFALLIAPYLPLVYGSALRLLSEDVETATEVATAVFESLRRRWRRLPKRTVISAWLLRSTWFAARQRRSLGDPPRRTADALVSYEIFLKHFFRLKPAQQHVLLLYSCLQQSSDRITAALRMRKTRCEKTCRRGIKILSKKLKRLEHGPEHFLTGLPSLVPSHVEALVLGRLREPPSKRTHLVRSTLRAWRWAQLRLRLKRLGAALGTVVCLAALLAASFIWLARHGYVTQWFIRLNAKQLAKDIPELAQPARPWPISPQDRALVQNTLPNTAAELYHLTNIWLAELSFTPEQWRRMAPSRVPPVPNLFGKDGKMVLRNPKARRSGLAGALGMDFNWTEGRLDFADSSFNRVAVRYRGNGTYINSLYGPKQSFKADLNQFTKKQRLAGVDTLNFVNSIPDGSYLHDALAERLFRDLGTPAPRTAFAYVSVNVPGKFSHQPLGLYVLIENIDSDFAADRFGSKSVPIFKPVTTELFEDLGAEWAAYADIYDLKTKATPEQKQRIIDLAQIVTHATDEEFARRLPEFLDLGQFAAFLAGHVLLSSYDGFLANGQNLYLYLDPRSNQFGFIPWDQDHAWGEFGYVGAADQREHASIWQPEVYPFRFLKRVMKVEAFRTVYRATLENALEKLFTKERLFAQIDQLATAIRPAVAAESDFRLRRFEQSVSDQWLPGPRENGNPEGPKAPVHQIKRFITNRIISIREQLDGKSEGIKLSGKW